MYANFDDLNMAISHINQWGKSRYFYRSPSRMKTTAVVFISLPGVFMSHLATQLGYSAGEFQALQLIVLVAFGVVD